MQEKSYGILAITEKQSWDDFVTSQPNHTFLHSWAWGEFNAAMGDRIWRLGVYNGATIKAVALIIKVHARRGNFLFIPHGPMGDREALPILVNKAKELANQEGANFIRVSPLVKDNNENLKMFQELGFRPAPIHMHAETTWTLDLTPTEEELLAAMRKTTRNLVRRSVKEGVEIKTGTSERDVEVFYNLYKETVKKHNFTPFSLTFLKKQVTIFADANEVRIFSAWHNGQPLASAIVIFYGNSAFYHHGASIPSKIPATYLLQWEAIREAKRRGHTLYNFWGIIKDDAPLSHPWQGITLFKKGFGGFQTDYLHAQDMPLTLQYWITWTIETIRKKIRHL